MNEQTSYDQELMSQQVQTASIQPVDITVEIFWLQGGYSEPLRPQPMTARACWLNKRPPRLDSPSLAKGTRWDTEQPQHSRESGLQAKMEPSQTRGILTGWRKTSWSLGVGDGRNLKVGVADGRGLP